MNRTADVPNIFVYGSCVARDTVEVVRDRVDLSGYVARQSLLSVGSDARHHLPHPLQLDSTFQRRMVRDDFAGSLLDQLTESAHPDVLLWDIADERHGVHRFDDGAIVTRSIETISSEQLTGALEAAQHLALGDRAHREAWAARAEEFVATLRGRGMLDRTVVLEVPWALHTTEGKPSPWSMGTRAKDANARFRHYYAVLHDLGVHAIALREDEVVADPTHRWGLAPFHYEPSVYKTILRRLAHDRDLPGLALR